MNESIESKTAFAVYDSKTGQVRHLHQVTIHRGAQPRSSEESQAQALEHARQRHPSLELEVVEVSPDELQGRGRLNVDLGTRALKAD